MLKLSAFVICLVLLSPALAVVNNGNQEAQRRDAALLAESYGPPLQQQSIDLPAPVYGAPAVAHYPPPPPDIPPPAPVPHKEYGVPVASYGPPKVSVEYGPPQYKSTHHQKSHFRHSSAQKKQPSFFDSIFSSFGFGAGEQSHSFHSHSTHPSPSYGPPQKHHPAPVYGPPPPPPPQPHPAPVYGPPAPVYGPPAPIYGPPQHKPAPPPKYFPKPSYGVPKHIYGPPNQVYGAPIFGQIKQNIHAPPTPPEIKCDGWKPIPGPPQNLEIHSPDSSYGPPPSGDFVTTQHGQNVEGLQLPHIESGSSFHNDFSSSGFGFSKGSSAEIHSNFISDSYGAPHVGSFSSGHYKPSFGRQPSKLISPSGIYGVPPGGSYAGLAISHGTVSGNLKPWPVPPQSPPTHPISYRPPVPQGLIESIGHTVEQLDHFGSNAHHSSFGGDIYLPPPTNDISSPSFELNSLPYAEPAKPFLTQHQLPEALPLIQEPRQNNIIISTADCGNGPDFGGNDAHIEQSHGQELSLGYATQQFQQEQSHGQEHSAQQFSVEHSSHGQEQSQGHTAQQFVIEHASHAQEQSQGHQQFSAEHSAHAQDQSQGQQFAVEHSSHAQEQSQDHAAAQQYALEQSHTNAHQYASAQGHSSAHATSYSSQSAHGQNTQQYTQHTSVNIQPSVQTNQLTIYGTAASGKYQDFSNAVETSYGPPASGGGEYRSGGQESHQISEPHSTSNLPGLDGLNILSAHQSQSLTIPVQGNLGSYQLQFQAADPIGSPGNSIHTPPHEQILSEGLLQSILTAIEQPQQHAQIQQTSYDPNVNHNDVAVFLKSPEGQKSLAEPSPSSHKR